MSKLFYDLMRDGRKDSTKTCGTVKRYHRNLAGVNQNVFAAKRDEESICGNAERQRPRARKGFGTPTEIPDIRQAAAHLPCAGTAVRCGFVPRRILLRHPCPNALLASDAAVA